MSNKRSQHAPKQRGNFLYRNYSIELLKMYYLLGHAPPANLFALGRARDIMQSVSVLFLSRYKAKWSSKVCRIIRRRTKVNTSSSGT